MQICSRWEGCAQLAELTAQRGKPKSQTLWKIVSQQIEQNLPVFHTPVGRMNFTKLRGRNAREIRVLEEPTWMAMQMCIVQFKEDVQSGPFAIVAVDTIPGWSRASIAFRFSAASHDSANAGIQIYFRQ
jgi:hypothetical protein